LRHFQNSGKNYFDQLCNANSDCGWNECISYTYAVTNNFLVTKWICYTIEKLKSYLDFLELVFFVLCPNSQDMTKPMLQSVKKIQNVLDNQQVYYTVKKCTC
jgi:hypothetical protein